MMSWSPTARRNGISGAVRLFSRKEWRDSPHGPALRQVVRSALDDADHINRFHAAHAVRSLEPESQAAIALLRQRLLTEPDNNVAAVLTNELAALAPGALADVDSVVDEIMTSSTWQVRLASTDHPGLEPVEPLIALVLWLAIRHETPAATAFAARWFTHPVARGVPHAVFWKLRGWLSLPTSRAAERRRAFDLLRAAARAIESLRRAGDATDAAKIYRIADDIVDQIYFASGAFGTTNSNNEPTRAPDGFEEEAFAVHEMLTEFKHPSIVHHMVATLGHLSPSAPRRAFLLIERTISPGDPYTYDSLAADTTIAIIERYMAEYRDVLASDPEVLTAVRRVLDAFVRVGWPAAVSLSYRLGDAFR
jgi:hypothetical protein